VKREPLERVPVAVAQPVVEEVTEPATVEEQAAAIDTPEPEMISLDLAVLITARYRTVRQALKAAALLAARHEWYHLEKCATCCAAATSPPSAGSVCTSSADIWPGVGTCRRH
jgi:hypothetical protein